MPTLFDDYAKGCLVKLLRLVCPAQAEHPVLSQLQRVDVTFASGPRAQRDIGLGALGRMAAQGPGMIEYFSKTPSYPLVEECIRKQLNYRHGLALDAKRSRHRAPPRPILWILSPGRPRAAMAKLAVQPMHGWPAGFWQARQILEVRFVVLRELPGERETLLIRLQGRGRLFEAATDELERLPDDAPERTWLTPIVVAMREQIAHHAREGTKMNPQDLQDVRDIERLIEIGEQHLRDVRQRGLREGRAKGLQQGRKEGRDEGERALLTRQLERRFGPLPKAITRRVEAAGSDALERWGERVLDAGNLGEVFAADPTARRGSVAARSAKQPAKTPVKTRSTNQPTKRARRTPAKKPASTSARP